MPDVDADKPPSPEPVPSTAPLQIGSYRLVHPLGSGGMSSVFLATHVESGHEVALKVLPRSLAKNPTLLQRFLREAKSAESLEHPNIVAIYDRGSEQGRYYLVLEYVSGGDLHDWVRLNGPMPVDRAVGVAIEVARGLEFAAERGLIHRDLKPANILFTAEGHPKITDLGLAVQLSEEDERVTRDGTTVGTVDYMSPEQARDSRATSVRSDIYSLGCTLYHLLTGAPPFTGGTVPEKLKRHATETPPDLRIARPDVPEALAKIVSKMLAKRPEKRHASYADLVAELEKVPLDAGTHDGPLYALVDDGEEDLGSGFLKPGDNRAAAATRVIEPGRDGSNGAGRGAKPVASPSRPEINLAALAGLEDDKAPAARKRGRAAESEPRRPGPAGAAGEAGSASEAVLARGLTAPPPRVGGQPAGSPQDLNESIVRGLLLGGALVLIGLVVVWALRAGGGSEDAAGGPDEVAAAPVEGGPEPLEPPVPTPVPVPVARGPLAVPETAWTEPVDTDTPPAAEPALPDGLLRGFAPAWLGRDPAIPGPVQRVRRIPGPDDPGALPTIARAGATPAGTIEIADDGPFFESDLALVTRPRRVRAAAGYRPIVVLDPPRASSPGRPASAWVTIEGQHLVLEGLDLVVPLDAWPESLSAVFACPSGSLVLRDCTVTFAGSGSRRIVLARLGQGGAAAPPRLALERTWVSGPAVTAVEFHEGGGEVVLDRSVVLAGDAPVVDASRPPAVGAKGARRLVLFRDLLVSRQPLLQSATSATAPPVTVRALGTTVARLEGAAGASLIALRGNPPAGLAAAIDWAGDRNTFVGWNGWLSVDPGTGRRVDVADLAAARRTWGAQEGRSREETEPLHAELGAWATPVTLSSLAEGGLAPATLARVAPPTPGLAFRTLDRFEPRPAPPPLPDVPPRGATESTFNTAGAPWNGDLGKYLADQVPKRTAAAVFVRVRGHGRHTMSPYAVPDGVSLWIEVEPPAAGAGDPVTFAAAPGASAPALLSTRRGDLVIRGARFQRAGDSDLEHLIRVEDGHLALERCRLAAEGAVAGADGGRLVAFVAATTRTIPGRWSAAGGISSTANERPTARLDRCVLSTGGVAVEARLGHGVVWAGETAVAAGRAAFRLEPADVGRARFAADLQLIRCTVAAQGDFVEVGGWSGRTPGPNRPWLVATERCAFVDLAAAGGPPSVLLRGAADVLARGILTWQSDGDAYQPGRFAVAEGVDAGQAPTPDLRRDWVGLWGAVHIQAATGPPAASLQLAGGRSDPSRLAPESLRLVGPRADLGAPPEVVAPPPPPPVETRKAAAPGTGRPGQAPVKSIRPHGLPRGQPF